MIKNRTLKFYILFVVDCFSVESTEIKKESGNGVGLLKDDLLLTDESDDDNVSYSGSCTACAGLQITVQSKVAHGCPNLANDWIIFKIVVAK